jgi:hypothetical protein
LLNIILKTEMNASTNLHTSSCVINCSSWFEGFVSTSSVCLSAFSLLLSFCNWKTKGKWWFPLSPIPLVSLIFKMTYFLSWPVQELLKKARVRCAIANSKIFAKTFNIFIRGRYLYQWYYYNHNAKRYENVIRGIINWEQYRKYCVILAATEKCVFRVQ